MVLMSGLLTALLIVIGQALWKQAVQNTTKAHFNIASVDGALKVLFSFPLIIGLFVYALATALYIYFLSKYKYYQIQSIVVGSSLIFTFLASSIFFKEHASVINILGLTLILAGSFLIIR